MITHRYFFKTIIFLPTPKKKRLLSYLNTTDLTFYLPNNVLTKVDRACMAFGLEVRVPFLNQNVINAGFSLPFKQRMQKKILREILSDYLPPALFERPKKGFAVPIGKYLRTELKDWAENLLDKEALLQAGLPAETIHHAWKMLQKGQDTYQHDVWGILMLLLWMDAQ
ncbi:MAG: asparagine synthase-related protein [Alphaproteobacteria bacterium]